MIETGSVETVEMRSIILKDGTPALQRIYRWRQVALSTPLVGSYILFKNGNALIEFHTDFSQEEWAAFNPGIQEIILGITLAP